MNVYAFYEPIREDWVDQKDQEILVSLWKKSWSHYGWNPIILSLEDAKKHPLYEEYYNIVKTFPTVNPKTYELYCFLRWLSFANQGGWISAVSCMNYGFKPYDPVDKIITSHLHPFIVPTVSIYVPKEKFKIILELIMNYKINHNDFLNVGGERRPHMSDMILLNSNLYKTEASVDRKNCLNFSSTYGDLNWKKSLITHYPMSTTCILGDIDKHKTRTQVVLEDPRWKDIM